MFSLAALDPFGVDVDISIETPAKKPRSERATEMDQAQKEKVEKAREAKENMTTKSAESSLPKDDAAKPMEITETTMPKPVQEETPKIPEEPKDTDEDWTLLDQTSPNMSHSASASPEPETPLGSQAAGAARSYPKLDNNS